MAISLVPLGASLVVGGAVARAMDRAEGVLGLVLWWIAVLGSTLLTLLVVERLARRLLPLAMLLRLALLFPDQAPNRFRLALRSSTVRQAQRAAAAAGDATTAAQQAELALTLVAALNVHDRRTRGHSERVRALTLMVGEEMSLEGDELDKLEWAGLLHDIGKIRVPTAILNKPGPPDDDEWAVLRRHPGDGGVIMAPLAGWLGPWVHGVDGHHECHDGTGYPLGLSGNEIALSGRIVAVTDAFETMTAVRSYKRAMSIEAGRAELVNCAGTQFNPAVVRAVLGISLPRLLMVLGPVACLFQIPLVARVSQVAIELGGFARNVTGGLAPLTSLAAVAILALGTVGGGASPVASGAAEAPRATAAPASTERTPPRHHGADVDVRGASLTGQGADATDEGPGGDDPGASSTPSPGGSTGSHTGSSPDIGTENSGSSGNTGSGPPSPPPDNEPPPEVPSPVVVPPVEIPDVPNGPPPNSNAGGNALGHIIGNGHTSHGNGNGFGHDHHSDP